jgi:hypothetical protein
MVGPTGLSMREEVSSDTGPVMPVNEASNDATDMTDPTDPINTKKAPRRTPFPHHQHHHQPFSCPAPQ